MINTVYYETFFRLVCVCVWARARAHSNVINSSDTFAVLETTE